MHVHYVTSNAHKFQEAFLVLKESQEWILQHLSLDLEEIQGSSREIVHHKAQIALARVQEPLIVEDVSMSCPALGGLPGPYVKDFMRAIGPIGLAQLVHQARAQQQWQLGNQPGNSNSHYDAEVSCHAVFIAPGISPIYSVGSVQGQLVPFRDPSKQHAMHCNSIFLQEGELRTYSEMSPEEMSQISMRKKALMLLLESYRQVVGGRPLEARGQEIRRLF